jgi:hypothetical protein
MQKEQKTKQSNPGFHFKCKLCPRMSLKLQASLSDDSILFHWEIADNELILSSLFNLSCPAKLVRAELLSRLSTDLHLEIHDVSYSISKYDSFTGIILYVPILIF